jgi:hypothetical protein
MSPVEDYQDIIIDSSASGTRKSPRKQPIPHKKSLQERSLESDTQEVDDNHSSSDESGKGEKEAERTGPLPSTSGSRSSRAVTKVTAVFDEEVEDRLCEFIEGYPVLWQSTHKEYSNTDKRNQIWTLAAQEFGEPCE